MAEEDLIDDVATAEVPTVQDSTEGFPLELMRPGYTEDALRLLIHGDPGQGKTFLCGTAADDPRTHPVLFVDTEGGTLTIREKDVQVVRVTSYRDIVRLVTYLRKGNHKYKSIVIDSLTEMQKLIMADILRENQISGSRSHDPDMPEQRDWGKNAERVRKVVRAFRDLPKVHVIFTCLSQEVKDEQTGHVTIKPSLPGKLRDEVPGFIDVVGWLHTAKVTEQAGDKKTQRLVRQIMFQPEGRIIAKDRSAALGTIMVDPTIPKILSLILKGEKQ
jgi:hypothetical protein